MTVNVIIPVFNRLALTKSLIFCLRHQVIDQALKLLVVDDGSSDGTSEWLSDQPDIEVLCGDGSLFWGGAVDRAVRFLQTQGAAGDWVLLMNNDTTVSNDFVQRLLDGATAFAPAAVGSVIRDVVDHSRMLSIGTRLDAWRLLARNFVDDRYGQSASGGMISVDVLSGRGVLFPLAALVAAGGMRPRLLPHYLADYELSLRVRKSGWRLLVLTSAAVFSDDDYGSTQRPRSWRNRLLSIRSPTYLPAQLAFWWQASSWIQRVTLPLRLPLFLLLPRLRKART